jgi:hypothetical protein
MTSFFGGGPFGTAIFGFFVSAGLIGVVAVGVVGVGVAAGVLATEPVGAGWIALSAELPLEDEPQPAARRARAIAAAQGRVALLIDVIGG